MEQSAFNYAEKSKRYGSFAAATGLKPGTTEYKLAWARANRERRREHVRRHYETHTEEKREYGKRYRRENPEKRAATVKSWAERNPDKVRAARNRNMRKAYRQNPEKFILREASRRFRNGTVTREEWRAIFEAHRGLCVYCGDPATAIDHVIPLARGGTHTKDNIVPACKPCNSSKHDKLLSEWKGRQCRKSA